MRLYTPWARTRLQRETRHATSLQRLPRRGSHPVNVETHSCVSASRKGRISGERYDKLAGGDARMRLYTPWARTRLQRETRHATSLQKLPRREPHRKRITHHMRRNGGQKGLEEVQICLTACGQPRRGCRFAEIRTTKSTWASKGSNKLIYRNNDEKEFCPSIIHHVYAGSGRPVWQAVHG